MSLKQKTISGIAWNGVGNITRQILQMITLIVMARFLSPSDFGVYSILMIFVSFIAIFADMGISQVITHIDNPGQRMLSSIFYFNMVVGFFLFGLLYLLAWPIAEFFNNQEIVHLLQIIGFSFVITSFGLVQKTLLEKALHFKRVITLETISQVLSAISGVVAAIKGFGIYSILIATLLNSGLFSIGLWLNSHWRPLLVFSIADIRQIWSYSFNLTSFSVINYFARSADNFLIGKFLGSSALGVYSVAYKIMLYPLDNVSRVMVRVLFPAFSHLKHDNVRFKRGYLKALSFIALITFPIMAGLIVVAEPFVSVIFGNKWQGLPILLIILAPIGMIQSIVTTIGSIYTAKGTTGLMFKIGVVNSIVTVTSFIIGLPYGVEGVAEAYTISNLVMLYPNLKFAWSQIGLGVFEGLVKLVPFLFISIVMAVTVYFQGVLLFKYNVGLLYMLLLQIISGITIYIGLMFLIYKKLMIGLIDELRKKETVLI